MIGIADVFNFGFAITGVLRQRMEELLRPAVFAGILNCGNKLVEVLIICGRLDCLNRALSAFLYPYILY